VGVAEPLLGLATEWVVSDARAIAGSFVWVVAALGLGASRFIDVDRGGERLLRAPPGRVSVVGITLGAALEAPPGAGAFGVTTFEAGACSGAENQSESTSSVLGAEVGPNACDLLAGADSGFDWNDEFGFDDSLDDAVFSAGASGLDG